MNILLINHYTGSPKHGMEYRPYYLAKEWVKNGHSVMILAASYSHIRTQQPKMEGKLQMDEVLEGIHYRWYKTSQHTGNGLGRVKNILLFLKALWSDTNNITAFNPDVVIASSTYPMDIWPARRIAKKTKAKLVYEVHDLWPLSPIELGGMPRWHPFIIWCQLAENYAYRYADKVVSMLPKTQSHMESHGMKPEKFHYIPNGINLEEWETLVALPESVATELKRVKQLGVPIVGYAGTHGLANALDVLLDVASLSKNKFQVVLVGKGPDRNSLLKRVEDEGLSNVTMLPAIPKKSIPLFLSLIDIAYIGWHKNPLYRFGISPNKIMDYMMAGRPIVHSVEAGNDPVAEAQCGITVAPLDLVAIRNAILELSNMEWNELKKMGENGHKYVLNNHTYPILAQKFIDVLEK